jgi:hypothetical protein
MVDLFNGDIEADWVNGENGAIPSEFSVRDLLGDARQQGECGSCWAFSSIAALEPALNHFVQENYGFHTQGEHTSLDLSEQYLLDCHELLGVYMNCDAGGLPISAMLFMKLQGAATELEMPYTGIHRTYGALNCVARRFKYYKRAYIAKVIWPQTVDAAKKAMVMYKTGLSVFWDAGTKDDLEGGPASWEDGVLSCGGKIIESVESAVTKMHAVTIVGWKGDTWIVRNSWGAKWPEEQGGDGHFLVRIGSCPLLEATMFGFKLKSDIKKGSFPDSIRDQFYGKGKVVAKYMSSASRESQDSQPGAKYMSPAFQESQHSQPNTSSEQALQYELFEGGVLAQTTIAAMLFLV